MATPAKMRPSSKRRSCRIVALVVALMTIAIGGVIYLDRVAPFHQTILMVNDTSITMRYFLKRVRLSGQTPVSMLQILMHEEIIKQVAPHPPYNIHLTEAEMDQALRDIARGASETITEQEFAAWYRQQLNDSQLSDIAFRDLIQTQLLRRKLHAYLAERVPTVAEQVHLHMIDLSSQREAEQVRARLQAGEDFAALAREVAADAQVRATGGDLGWFPRGTLTPTVSEVAFDQLSVGEISQPLALDTQHVMIVKVAERAAAREIAVETVQQRQAKALETWLQAELAHHQVSYHGFDNGYDSTTDAWVKEQLQQMRGTPPSREVGK